MYIAGTALSAQDFEECPIVIFKIKKKNFLEMSGTSKKY
jgi:hypothetical protein